MTEVTLDIDVRDAEQVLGGLADDVLPAALGRGLAAALEHGASEVTLLSHESGITPRTGTLQSEIAGRVDDGEPLAGRIGIFEDALSVRYAGLLTAEGIRPTAKRALTIPMGANLTAGGRARIASVAELEAAFGKERVFRLPKTNLIGVSVDGEFKPYFALHRHVRGRDVLGPGVAAARERMVEIIQEYVADAVEGA